MDEYATFYFLVIVFAAFIGCIMAIASSALFVASSVQSNTNSVESIAIAAIFDESKIAALKEWNYSNPNESTYMLGGCPIRRVSKDEWKINFQECN